MIENEISPNLTRELLIKMMKGEIEKLPRYQVEELTHKFIDKKDDPFSVARDIAESFGKGHHLYNLTFYVRSLAPDLPKDKLVILTVDVCVKAAAITIAEKIGRKKSRKEIEELYVHGIYSFLGGESESFEAYEDIREIVSKGIDYNLILLGKKIKKKRFWIFPK